jgi:hypothetical protein
MEQGEVSEAPVALRTSDMAPALPAATGRAAAVAPQIDEAPCPSCGGPRETSGDLASSYVYALGRIEARFPTASVEKEFAQATGRAKTAGKSDREALHAVLALRENRYLARQMCWVLAVQGLETYVLRPRDPADFDLLIDAIKGPRDPMPWMSLVVGLRGPIAAPDLCNGLMVPVVAFDQIYSFDYAGLIDAIPRPAKMTEKQFAAAAEELLSRVMQMTDNAGATDEHRALNYLALRYPAVHAIAAEQFAKDFSLSGVDVRQSPLGGSRSVVDVVFAYTNRNTDFTEKFLVRVDVTEEFPFLVSKMTPYYDR